MLDYHPISGGLSNSPFILITSPGMGAMRFPTTHTKSCAIVKPFSSLVKVFLSMCPRFCEHVILFENLIQWREYTTEGERRREGCSFNLWLKVGIESTISGGILPSANYLWTTSQEYWKEKTMESLICYCFGYTASDIERDVLLNGKSRIMERIMFEMKVGGCQCATKNPKGR